MEDEHRGTKRALDTSEEFTVPAVGDAGGAVVAADVAAPPESDASAARRIAQRQKQARRPLYI